MDSPIGNHNGRSVNSNKAGTNPTYNCRKKMPTNQLNCWNSFVCISVHLHKIYDHGNLNVHMNHRERTKLFIFFFMGIISKHFC